MGILKKPDQFQAGDEVWFDIGGSDYTGYVILDDGGYHVMVYVENVGECPVPRHTLAPAS